MTRRIVVTTLVGFALVAGACSSNRAQTITIDEYATSVAEIESSFNAATPDASEPLPEFVIGGDLVAASEIYFAYERRVQGWSALTAPSALSKPHRALVTLLVAFQDEVGAYLNEAGLKGEDFDFASIGEHPEIRTLLEEAGVACTELVATAADLGVDLEIGEPVCQF